MASSTPWPAGVATCQPSLVVVGVIFGAPPEPEELLQETTGHRGAKRNAIISAFLWSFISHHAHWLVRFVDPENQQLCSVVCRAGRVDLPEGHFDEFTLRANRFGAAIRGQNDAALHYVDEHLTRVPAFG